MRYSACIEWLFAEAGGFPERVRAARNAGIDAVEFWTWSNKDLDALGRAVADSGVHITGMLAEPTLRLTDEAKHAAFFEGFKRTIEVAQKLSCPRLIFLTGNETVGRSRPQQRAALVECLRRSADLLKGSGVEVMLEPLNTRIDHAGYFLSSTTEGLDIVDEVGRPEVRLLYDIYHSAVMGEDMAEVLAGRLDRVAHVHLADVPGRHEPGSGSLDWARRLQWLEDNGYRGAVGLEYVPSTTTAATLTALRRREA